MKPKFAPFTDLAFARAATAAVVQRLHELERDLAEKEAALKRAEADLERERLLNYSLAARPDCGEDRHAWGLEPGVGL